MGGPRPPARPSVHTVREGSPVDANLSNRCTLSASVGSHPRVGHSMMYSSESRRRGPATSGPGRARRHPVTRARSPRKEQSPHRCVRASNADADGDWSEDDVSGPSSTGSRSGSFRRQASRADRTPRCRGAAIHVWAGEAIRLPASSTWTPRPLPAPRLTSPARLGRAPLCPRRPARHAGRSPAPTSGQRPADRRDRRRAQRLDMGEPGSRRCAIGVRTR